MARDGFVEVEDKRVEALGHTQRHQCVEHLDHTPIGLVRRTPRLFQRPSHLRSLGHAARLDERLHLRVGHFELRHIVRQVQQRHRRRILALAVGHQVGDEPRLALQLHVGVNLVILDALHQRFRGLSLLGHGELDVAPHRLFVAHEQGVAQRIVLGDWKTNYASILVAKENGQIGFLNSLSK